MLDDDEAEVGDDELPDNRALGDNQIRGKNQGVPLEEMVKRVDETNIDYDLLGYLVRALVKETVMGAFSYFCLVRLKLIKPKQPSEI